jgi:hypothetical protein
METSEAAHELAVKTALAFVVLDDSLYSLDVEVALNDNLSDEELLAYNTLDQVKALVGIAMDLFAGAGYVSLDDFPVE